MTEPGAPPLAGLLVVDASRMLPGGVVARMLLDLGARLIKVEAPKGGDPLRQSPPLVAGIGSGFCVHFRGAESLRLDLRRHEGIASLRRLLQRADVFLQSFRPGTLESWGLDWDSTLSTNVRLVACSLPAYPGPSLHVGHDLDFMAETGLLRHLGLEERVPPVQIADTMAAILATTSILAGLIGRDGRKRGLHIEQPLVSGPLPLLAWSVLDRTLGQTGVQETLLAGRLPSYRTYRCADDRFLAVGCLEPKFFIALCDRLGCPELSAAALDLGERGRAAADALSRRFLEEPSATWRLRLHDLPVTIVAELGEVGADPHVAPFYERLRLPDGSEAHVPGAALALGLGRSDLGPAPRLGEHDDALGREFLGRDLE